MKHTELLSLEIPTIRELAQRRQWGALPQRAAWQQAGEGPHRHPRPARQGLRPDDVGGLRRVCTGGGRRRRRDLLPGLACGGKATKRRTRSTKEGYRRRQEQDASMKKANAALLLVGVQRGARSENLSASHEYVQSITSVDQVDGHGGMRTERVLPTPRREGQCD